MPTEQFENQINEWGIICDSRADWNKRFLGGNNLMPTPTIEEKQRNLNGSQNDRNSSAPRTKRHWWIWLIVLAALGYGGWHYRGVFASSTPSTPASGAGRGGRGGGAVPVAVATAVRGDIPVYLRNIGTVTAINTVTVRSRVEGQLINVAFQEGQVVHAGDLLAEIDSRPFQVQLEQAEGTLAHDTALLNDAKANFARYTELFQEGVIPKQQLDTQRANVGQYDGAIKSDQAQIDSAKLQLMYCHITSPITGRVGLRLVDAGNMVHATDTNGLVVITQVQPIAALVALPQKNLPDVFKQVRAGAQLSVEAYDQDGINKLASGKLLTIDNAIDPATDTFKLKAVFDNEDNHLFPNQFVNISVLVGSQKGLTIVPSTAIQRGPQGTFVFVVNSNGTVSIRPVKQSVTEGTQSGLSEGLQPGEVVVVDGQDKLQDGTKIDARSSSPSPAPNVSAPAPAARGGKK
jgi:multidrug efflux system membrane fusion protein